MSERSRNLARARTMWERWERSEKGRAHVLIYLIEEAYISRDSIFSQLAGSSPALPSFSIDPGCSRFTFTLTFSNLVVIV